MSPAKDGGKLKAVLLSVHRLVPIKEWVDKNDPGAVLIPISGVFESKYMEMEEAERAKCKVSR
jgi:hypothetical protein